MFVHDSFIPLFVQIQKENQNLPKKKKEKEEKKTPDFQKTKKSEPSQEALECIYKK